MAHQRRICTFFKCFVLCVIVGSGVIFTGCQDKDDYLFNYEYVKELYERTFPVKNIDLNQDWKTTNLVDVNVSVDLEYGETYKIVIYTANPLSEVNTCVLGKGQIVNGGNFSIKVNSPKDRATLFVSCKDSKNKLLIQQFKVSDDGTVDAVFGTKIPRSRSLTSRGVDGSSDMVSFSDYGLEDLQNYRKDEYLYTEEDTSKPVSVGRDYVWVNSDLKDQGSFLVNMSNAKVVLIDGTVTIGNDGLIPADVKIIVVGKLIIKEAFAFSVGKQNAKIIVWKGGEVNLDLTRTASDFLQGVDNLPIIYNAGTLSITVGTGRDAPMITGIPTIYNVDTGSVKINSLSGISMTNYGKIKITESTNLVDVRNYCHITVDGDLGVQGNAVVGDKARLDVSGALKPSGTLTLGDNAIVDINAYQTGNATNVVGPTSSAYPAVLKLNTFSVSKAVGFQGVVYVSEAETGSGNGYEETCANIEYLLPVHNAGITIESSGCNGNGFEAEEIKPDPGPTPDPDPNPDPTVPQTYTYCFEDYYPTPGDYDFNDVVMDIAFEPIKGYGNTVNRLIVNITLSAVGANYQLGAALQLVGIPQNSVNSVTVSNTSFNDRARTLFKQSWETETQTGGKGVVVPLYNDAHYVLTGQNSNRYLFNTSQGHEENADATPRTMTVEVSFNENVVDDITLDNLDLFIARPTISENGYYEGQEGRTRIEIHLYQFWDYLTNNSVNFAGNIAAAGNRTWGICVPNFKYPYETISIKEAYPMFEKWAQDRSSNIDWYNHPNNSKVYR